MTKNFLKVCILCFSLLAAACESAEISMVKNAALEYDKSKKWGEVFDNYRYASEGEWLTLTAENGQELVRFQATYNVQGFFDEINAKKQVLPAAVAEKAKQILDSQTSVKLLADFAFTADKKYFSLSYLGFEINGSSPQRYEKQIENDFISLINNKPLNYLTLTEEGQHLVTYALIKAMFESASLNTLQFAAAFDVSMLNNAEVLLEDPNTDPRSPMIIYSVKDVEYYDQKQDIYLKLDYETTNMPEPEMDTVYLGREDVLKNLGNAEILYKNEMRVQLAPVSPQDFYDTLIRDSYCAINFGSENSGNIGMFLYPENNVYVTGVHTAAPASNFQEWIDGLAAQKEKRPADTSREEITLGNIKEQGAKIIAEFCIYETDACGELTVLKGSQAYNFIRKNQNNLLYNVYLGDITKDGVLVQLTPFTPEY